MPKRKQPTNKTMEDETENKDAKEVEPKLKQTKKADKAEDKKPAAKETRSTRGKSKENGTMEEESKDAPKKVTPKKETPKKETPKKETPKKDKMEEEKPAKGRGKSKENGKKESEEEEEEEKPIVKKVVNKGKGAKGKKEDKKEDEKEEEKEESPAKGKRGRSKKNEKEDDKEEEKEEPKKKGRGKSKAKEEGEGQEGKVIVKKVTNEDGEGETTVTATIPKNPKKLNRNRSSIEDILDDYEHNTRAIALGDGKFESKEITVSSWNVNGLNALLKKDHLHNYMKDVQPDIICLNEIKLTDENCEELGTKWIPDGYSAYFNCCKIKKGYAGVAIVSKHKPISVKFDLGIKKHDLEGRTITAEFEHFYLVSCYVPNAGDKLVGLSYRTEEWDPDFKNYLGELKKKKHVILCGDLNCAHKEIDLFKPKGNEKTAGFTPQERKEFTALLDSGFVDTFRHFYPEEKKYSYFSIRFKNNRAENKGWRLDYFLVDKEAMPSIKDSTINDKIEGSDHLPIELKFNPNFDTQPTA